MNEVIERIRRIETKLSRFIAGEPDQATHLQCEGWHTDDNGFEVEVNSMSISLQAVITAARKAGCMDEEVLVCDNGKPRMIFRMI